MIFSKEELKKLFLLWFNPISITGFTLAVISAVVIIALTLIQLLFPDGNPYSGLVTFIVIPPFFIIGLLMIPLGIFRQNRKLHKTGKRPNRFFTIDFNLSRHRKMFVIFLVATSLVVIIVATISSQAFHYTESVEFCSSCHSVMDPESITHKRSSHARVSCVECHVGEGVDWYVKSKLSGMYQLYSVLFKKYSKPIATPIHNLRPARDTCETCHWPQFFVEDKMLTKNYFLPDEENTAGAISLLMKVGGKPEFSKPSGIHWHITNKVRFITTDEKEQDIPWIQVEDEHGEMVVYESTENPLSEEEIKTMYVHEMDCMDCHNRPSHVFKTPENIMNRLLYSKKVSTDLPNIRKVGSEALNGKYESTEEAVQKIAEMIRSEYKDNEDVEATEVDEAVDAILVCFKQNFFPEMKTRWDVHFSNIGHKRSMGCFRCHDDLHENEEGDVISRDCNHCHMIVAQGEQGEEQLFDPRGLEFIHPEDIDEEWQDESCMECHTGE